MEYRGRPRGFVPIALQPRLIYPFAFCRRTPVSGLARQSPLERCPSGRRSTPGKCVYGTTVPRVRIPPSPPIHENAGSLKPAFLCPQPRRSGLSVPCKRTSGSTILLPWFSPGPISFAATPRKRTHRVLVAGLIPPVRSTGCGTLHGCVDSCDRSRRSHVSLRNACL